MKITYVGAKYTPNGNPRRGWIVEEGDSQFFIDEGGEGRNSLYAVVPQANAALYPLHKISVARYNELNRFRMFGSKTGRIDS